MKTAPFQPLIEWVNTLLNRLPAERAAKIDNVDVSVSSRAAAATALSRGTWTDELAALLGGLATAHPLLVAPKAGGLTARAFAAGMGTAGFSNLSGWQTHFGSVVEAATIVSNTSWVDVVNYAGAGVVQLVAWDAYSNGGASATVEIIIDGVTVLAYTSAALSGGAHEMRCAIGDLKIHYDGAQHNAFAASWAIPFRSSLQIRAKTSSTYQSSVIVATALRKTA